MEEASAQMLMSLVASATGRSNVFPGGHDATVARALLSSTGRATLQKTQMMLKRMLNRVMKECRHGCRMGNGVSAGKERVDEDTADEDDDDDDDDFEMLFQRVSDVNEDVLEQARRKMDEALGLVEKEVTGRTETTAYPLRKRSLAELSDDIPKPQLNFHDWPPDNSESPFIPRPLPGSDSAVHRDVMKHLDDTYRGNRTENGEAEAPVHPVEKLVDATLESLWKKHSIPPSPLEVPATMTETRFTFVDSEEKLTKMLKRIRKVDEISVDLEHHDYRSFLGFTCLVQISTREEDFVIDALRLRRQLNALNKVFLDGNIVKVFHGARSDVQWLERDFGVYVVGLFDTGQAAKVLEYPSLSLSFLLEKFCSISSPNKKLFQLSDWRIRPLPEPMLEYARQDTHYLLYIYDCLRKELDESGRTKDAWYMSRQIGLIRYEKPAFNGSQVLARTISVPLNPTQARVLEEILRWRDRIAREKDESLHYVIPNK